MGKVEYLDALKRALAGLPPQLQAKTLAYYEQRFVDGAAAGRVDTDTARALDGPLRQFISSHDVASHNDAAGYTTRTRVWIDDDGVHVVEQDSAHGANAAQVIRRAEAIAGHGIRISTGMDAGARTTQTLFGLSMVVGAIILFLLSLVVTRYTIVGIRRYIDMNVFLFKGN